MYPAKGLVLHVDRLGQFGMGVQRSFWRTYVTAEGTERLGNPLQMAEYCIRPA
jgi:hypothetical protein